MLAGAGSLSVGEVVSAAGKQVLCSLLRSQLWFCFFRLLEAKSGVLKALADDFDTPRAVGALMNMIYHGNCQLQPVAVVTNRDRGCGSITALFELRWCFCQADEAARSPAVFGAMVTFIREMLEVFGVDLVQDKVLKHPGAKL